MQFNPKFGFYLGILVTIEIGISSGTVSLTHAIEPDWIPTVTAWAGLAAFVGSTVLTFLHAYSSGQPGPLVSLPAPPAAKIATAIGALALLAGLLAPGQAFAEVAQAKRALPAVREAVATLPRPPICDPAGAIPGCPKPALLVSSASSSTALCDFNLFTQLTPLNLLSVITSCISKNLLPDAQAALASAQAVNGGVGDKIATACLLPGVAIIQAGVGTPGSPAIAAVPATPAVPATDTSSAVPANPGSPAIAAVAPTLPGPILMFEKFHEFAQAGGPAACKTWINGTIKDADPITN